MTSPVPPRVPSPVPLRQALRLWLKLGLIGFGCGAARPRPPVPGRRAGRDTGDLVHLLAVIRVHPGGSPLVKANQDKLAYTGPLTVITAAVALMRFPRNPIEVIAACAVVGLLVKWPGVPG